MGLRDRVLGGVAVAALVGATGLVVVSVVAPPAPARAPWATAWDPAVAPLAAFVATVRQTEFTNAVAVDLLADEDFERELRASQPGGRPVEDEVVAGTVGFYDPDDRRIRVRGTTLTPVGRITLVHELTHALQDQRVGLAAAARASRSPLAYDALLEGEAQVVEAAWTASRPGAERAELASLATGLGGSIDGVPEARLAAVLLPYELGPSLVRELDRRGGPAETARWLRDGRATDGDVLDPSRAGSGSTRTLGVALAEARARLGETASPAEVVRAVGCAAIGCPG